jgi:hypothetical protein
MHTRRRLGLFGPQDVEIDINNSLFGGWDSYIL